MYFIPRISHKSSGNTGKPIPPQVEFLPSHDLSDKIEAIKKKCKEGDATQWAYLWDAVSRNTVTPLEAYECLQLGFVPEYYAFRESAYMPL